MSFFITHKSERGTLCRTETLDGRECLVFPVVMMVEGVHCGSGGASFYSAEELGKTPGAWNMKPVVVRHPEQEGTPISACSKDILEKQSVGVLLNTSFEDGKLKSEAWLYTDKANKVQPGIIASLKGGKMMEVSIGHFSEDIATSGQWNGETYEKVAINIKPDHLALLPTERGACSVMDGAGIPRINCDMRTCVDLSHEDLRSFLYDRLQGEGIPSQGLWIEAVFDGYFVYYMPETSKYFKREYTVSNGEVSLGTTVTEVVRQIEYVTAKEINTMKEQVVTRLQGAGFSKEAIAAMSDSDFGVLESILKTQSEETGAGASPTPTDVSAYMEKCPSGIREVLEEGLRLQANRRNELMTKIKACNRNRFESGYLEGRSLQELEGLAALAEVPAAVKPSGPNSILTDPKPDFSANAAVGSAAQPEEPIKAMSLWEQGK